MVYWRVDHVAYGVFIMLTTPFYRLEKVKGLSSCPMNRAFDFKLVAHQIMQTFICFVWPINVICHARLY